MKSSQKPDNGFDYQSLADWKEAGKSLLEEASKTLKDKTKTLQEKSLHEISDDVTVFVKKYPLQSALMALTAGVVLGFLLKSSKSRD